MNKLSRGAVEKSEVGIRYDEGKVRMDRLDPQFLDMLGQVMTEYPDMRLDLIPKCLFVELGLVYTRGAVKYSDNNWCKGLLFSRVIGPVYRHLLKWMMGERRDTELGTHHLAQVIWNCVALMEYEKTHPELDDRPKRWLTLGDGK